VADTLARICTDSSDRIPKFLLPLVHDRLARHGQVRHSALVVAAWARYAEGVDEHGDPIEVVDQRRDAVLARAAHNRDDPLAFLDDPNLFGGLRDMSDRALRVVRTRLVGARSGCPRVGRRGSSAGGRVLTR
jgi:mannitol 2-dehydrogenase